MGNPHLEATRRGREKLAHRLRLAAARRGLNVVQVAKELDIAQPTVRCWFNGRNGPIRHDLVERVETAIKVWNAEARIAGRGETAVQIVRRPDVPLGDAEGKPIALLAAPPSEGRRSGYSAGYRDGYRAGFADGQQAGAR